MAETMKCAISSNLEEIKEIVKKLKSVEKTRQRKPLTLAKLRSGSVAAVQEAKETTFIVLYGPNIWAAIIDYEIIESLDKLLPLIDNLLSSLGKEEGGTS